MTRPNTLSGQEINTWLHLNADEVTFIRNAGKVKVHLVYCSSHSGCQAETSGEHIREAVEAAIKQDEEAAQATNDEAENDEAADMTEQARYGQEE